MGREILWESSGNRKSGHTLFEVDPLYFRPTEVESLLGDPTKAKERLGWSHKTTFDELVNEMVDADLRQLKNEQRFNRDD